MTSTEIKSIAIFCIHGVDYRCIITGISKSEAINLLKNAVLSENFNFFFLVVVTNNEKSIKNETKKI